MLDKNLQRVKISRVIGSQLPDFAADENPLFVEFLRQYYTSQEYQGGAVDLSENIDRYLNLEYFQQENYLKGETKLDGSIKYFSDTITVDSTESWPSEYGLLKIDDEIITYTGKTNTTFTGCIRGFSGIENLHKLNNPEYLVFTSSTAKDHNDRSTVVNLSNLFLQEFWKKLKIQFLPGFENRDFTPELDQAFFLSRAKDFYASKGTDEALKILFKVLYGDSVSVIKPQEFLIRPSNADWLITKNIIVEKVSGDPLKLNGQTLFQDSPKAFGQIYSSELLSLRDNSYYLIKLSDDSVIGDFTLTGFTKITKSVEANDAAITVDSTLGFYESGTLFIDGITIAYTGKSSTQFLGCSGITKNLELYSQIYQNHFVYSYEDGDLTKKVQLRVTGTLSDFDLSNTTNKYLTEGDEIYLKNLGENIKKGDYNNKFDHWLYNQIIEIELIDSNNKFTSTSSPTFVTTKTNHNLRRGDSVTLITSGVVQVIGNVTDIIYNNEEDRINNYSTTFEFAFTGTLNASLPYTLRKNINLAKSPIYSYIRNSFCQIQNTYIDKGKKYLYVTAPSLPNYNITATDRSATFTVSSQTDLITTISDHNFYTGQKVYLTSISGSLDGILPNAVYFIKKVTNNTFKLAFSLSRIDTEDYITFGGSGTHKVTPSDLYNKSLQDQKLFKRIPITPLPKDKNSPDDASTIGLYLNGVEIISNKSGDAVYYGQLDSIDVLSSGIGYDVINPPKIIITDSLGQNAEANACMSGSIDNIIVTNPGYNFERVPLVTITGGNGTNATAEAKLKSVQFSITFNGSSIGVNTTANTINFNEYHTFKNGDEVIYQSQNNTKIGIGLSNSSTTVDSYLVDNSVYYVRVVNDTTIQLMNTLDNALSGINPIPLNNTGFGNHKFLTRNFRKVISFIEVTNPGSGYKNSPIEVPSLAYPPAFPGISTSLVGINTVDNYVFAKNHGFETGNEIVYKTTGTQISGLSTQKSYYAIKIDDSKFRLIEKYVGVSTITGIGTTSSDQNLIDKTYTRLSSIGSGTHIFNHPPIEVQIQGVNESLNSSVQASAFVYSTGKIQSVFLKNGGFNYGSNVMNYHKRPLITVSSGSGAILNAIVSNGSISSVYVVSGGSGYVSVPNLIVSGTGKFAKLKAIISNESIESVQVIDGGQEYDQNTTSISIETLGSRVKIEGNVQKWKVNSFYKYPRQNDDGILLGNIDDTFGIKFTSLSAPKNLRRSLNDNLNSSLQEVGINTTHSPIIGWAYDGNPIYGTYGGNNQNSFENPKLLTSSYTLISKTNRPSLTEFPSGFFIEDYEYTSNGDLDEHNGRYCVTPEFPNGTYAYFATGENFPYVINSFKNHVDSFNFSFESNQNSSVLLDESLLRNTAPYRLSESNVKYEGFGNINNDRQKFVIDSIYKSGISTIGIINPGDNYKVGDLIKFDEENTSGRGVSAKVESLRGKNIHSIVYSENYLSNLNFVYTGTEVTGISSQPHNIKNGETLQITGIEDKTFKFFEGSYRVFVNSVTTSLQESVGTTSQTGIITSITLTEASSSRRLCVDDIIQLNNEQMLILKINKTNNQYVVEREYNLSNSSAHTQGTIVTLKPKRFSYVVNNSTVQEAIRENKVTYFDPALSVGIGTLGTKYFIGYGVSFTSVGISTGLTTRIFFESHSFNPSDFVEVTGGSPAGINTFEARITSVGSTFVNLEFNSSSVTSVGNTSTVLLKRYNNIGTKSIYVPCLSCGCESIPFQTFEPFLYSSNAGFGLVVSEYDNLSNPFSLQDNQIIYVTRLSEASDTLGIRTTRSGIGSLSTLYIVGIGTTTAKKHSLRTVNPAVIGRARKYDSRIFTQTPHGITTTSEINLNVIPNRTENVILKYNSAINKLVVNPVSFESTAIGVGSTTSTIYLQNHQFKTGDKVVYTSETSSASPLTNNESYYVIKFNDDYIKLANSYSDTLRNPPVHVAITTTGSGNHIVSLINPSLNVTRGNTIGFGISDSSMSDFDLKFYLDSDFKNEYSTKNKTQNGVFGDTSSSSKVNLKTNLETPKILYYQLVQKNILDGQEYLVDVDKDVNDFSKIVLNNSVYSGFVSVTGIGSTELSINNSTKSEHTLYDSTNTTELNYSTSSLSASGGIDKVDIIFEGVGYKKLPKVSSILSVGGSEAILSTESELIGKIKSTSMLSIGYNYPSDKTLQPKAELPTLVRISNNYTLDGIDVTNSGSGYLFPPVPIIIGHPNAVIESKLNGSSVGSVNVVLINDNLSINPPRVVSTKNTNGILITNAESDGAYNTITLKRPPNGFVNFPFIIGDKIYIEGAELLYPLSLGGGYNSSNYDYRTFEVTGLINDENVSSLTYKIPVGFGTTGGIFDSNNSIARVIKDSDLAKFSAKVKEMNFYEDEIISSSDGSTFKVQKNGWDFKNSILKVINLNKDILVGSTIIGESSKTKGNVIDVDYSDGIFKVDSYVRKKNGWQDYVGFTNDTFQRIHDSFYYQYFSYAINSKTPYSTWEEPVNALAHPAGFKAFSNLNITSRATNNANVSIGSSSVSLVIDINNIQSLYTKSYYEFASEETSSKGISKFVNLTSKNIIPSTTAVTNKVISIDDISPQFTGIVSTFGGNVVGLSSFKLLSGNDNILYQEFDPTNSNIISTNDSTITIPNHKFNTGEKLIYDPGIAGSFIGIATTSRVLSGVSTDLLPVEVYAYKVNESQIKLSGIKTDSTTNNIFFTFRTTSGSNIAVGKTHSLSVSPEIANIRSLITIDNIIQSPLYKKNINVGLSSSVGIGSTEISVLDTTNITSNTLLQIDEEIVKVNVVGFGSTTNLSVSRSQLNTVSAAHTVGAAVTVLGGDYTISKGYIYFTTPPYGTVGFNSLQPGISTQSTFNGRIFYRLNYDDNYIFDDISDQFSGNVSTGKTFILKSNSNNIENISNNNAIILINNIFQRPIGVTSRTDYTLTDDGVSGITTISFTGNTTESIPKGGIINEIEVGVGTGYTSGGYSNLSLIGGSGSGAKINVVIGAGGSVSQFELVDKGKGYKPNDILYLQSLSPVGINSITVKVLSILNNKFSGWTFGQLIPLDDFSNQFTGFRKIFTLIKTVGVIPQPYSIEKGPGSDIVLENNLLIFINDILQIPGKDYILTGGTQLTFTEAPPRYSKIKILYYQGSISDVKTEIPLQTIKIGDKIKLEKNDTVISQFDRIVTNILSSKKVETNAYDDIGISLDSSFTRPLTWTKQTSDLIINSEIIDKSREYLEPRINPITKLIKDFVPGDSVMYVQNTVPNFSIIDDTNETLTNVKILNNLENISGNAYVSTVSAAGTITSLVITNPGSGFSTSFTISLYSPSQIKEIGKTWSVGFASTIPSVLRDVHYSSDQLLYAACDDGGGISTSKSGTTSSLSSWVRKTPSFTTNNQLNGISYGSNIWVGVGSDGKVGYSTNNTSTWNSGSIYSYKPESGGLGFYEYSVSSTTRKFNSVAYGHGKFVAVGTGGTVLVSDDTYPAANTWFINGNPNISAPDGTGQIWLINVPSFVNNNNDPVSNITNTLNSVIYSSKDQRFVAVGNSGVIISSHIGSITNRQFTVHREPDNSYENLNDIAYGVDKYVVVGENGTVGYATTLHGPWITSTLATSENLNSVIFGNNGYVAVGNNGIVANSLNGIDWVIKTTLSSSVYSLTTNDEIIVGVGSESKYYITESEISKANITANIQNESISSFTINDGGYGYTNSSDIEVLIPNEAFKYENLYSVAILGDHGKIIGIGTSSSGIGTSSPMIIFSIQSDVGLNTSRIAGSAQLDPFIQRSGISTGDYFVTYNTVTGTGVTSINVSSGIVTVGVTTEYLDCVYLASKVDNNGVSGIVTVYCNVVSIVGVASTSVNVDVVGFDTTGKVGNYSWGKFYNFDARTNEKTFVASNKNGFSGIQTSPTIFRITPLKAQYQ
jgi:hypothetical protein